MGTSKLTCTAIFGLLLFAVWTAFDRFFLSERVQLRGRCARLDPPEEGVSHNVFKHCRLQTKFVGKCKFLEVSLFPSTLVWQRIPALRPFRSKLGITRGTAQVHQNQGMSCCEGGGGYGMGMMCVFASLPHEACARSLCAPPVQPGHVSLGRSPSGREHPHPTFRLANHLVVRFS
jgi:hypothetical protein